MLTTEELNRASGVGQLTPSSINDPSVNPDFMSTLQDTMMKQSGMISSTPTSIDTAIQGAIGKVNQSTTATGGAIASSYDRNIGYTNEKNQNELTAARERGVGINTSDVAYKALASEADKQLKDLEQRKNELLLQNDAAGAAKVADLMLNGMKMKQDAMQQTFANLLSMGNFGIQTQAAKRADQAQDFTQKSQIASIGLQYGIPVKEGETLQSIVTRAAPFATKEQSAKLGLLLAQTNQANAAADKSRMDGKVTANLNDPVNRQAYISMALTDPTTFNKLLVDNPKLVDIRNDAQKQQTTAIQTKVNSLVKSGITVYADVKAKIESDPSLGAQIDVLSNDKVLLDSYTQAIADKNKPSNKKPFNIENAVNNFFNLPSVN